jgi:hypothetical protein
MIELDPDEKQRRIDRLMELTKEEIAAQWVTLGSDMKEKYLSPFNAIIYFSFSVNWPIIIR